MRPDCCHPFSGWDEPTQLAYTEHLLAALVADLSLPCTVAADVATILVESREQPVEGYVGQFVRACAEFVRRPAVSAVEVDARRQLAWLAVRLIEPGPAHAAGLFAASGTGVHALADAEMRRRASDLAVRLGRINDEIADLAIDAPDDAGVSAVRASAPMLEDVRRLLDALSRD